MKCITMYCCEVAHWLAYFQTCWATFLTLAVSYYVYHGSCKASSKQADFHTTESSSIDSPLTVVGWIPAIVQKVRWCHAVCACRTAVVCFEENPNPLKPDTGQNMVNAAAKTNMGSCTLNIIDWLWFWIASHCQLRPLSRRSCGLQVLATIRQLGIRNIEVVETIQL